MGRKEILWDNIEMYRLMIRKLESEIEALDYFRTENNTAMHTVAEQIQRKKNITERFTELSGRTTLVGKLKEKSSGLFDQFAQSHVMGQFEGIGMDAMRAIREIEQEIYACNAQIALWQNEIHRIEAEEAAARAVAARAAAEEAARIQARMRTEP